MANETTRIALGDFHFFLRTRWTRAKGASELALGWVDTDGPHDLMTNAEYIPRSQGELGLCVRKYAVGRVALAMKSADAKDSKMGTPWFEERDDHAFASCSAFLGDGHIFVAVVGKPHDENSYAVLSIVIVRSETSDVAKEAETLFTEILESVDVVPS